MLDIAFFEAQTHSWIRPYLFFIYFNIMYATMCSGSRQQKQPETPN